MKIIVITGKSGSGKSEVSKILAKALNAKLICLDKVSHLSLEDKKIKEKLYEYFGAEIFDKDNIDRKKLGSIVFKNKNSLKKLNLLSWKFIDQYVDKEIKNTNCKFIILEYALLSKMKYFKMADYKILVKADQNIRINRVVLRDKITKDYAINRDKNSLEYSTQDFDFVIDNSNLKKIQLKAEILKIAKKIQI